MKNAISFSAMILVGLVLALSTSACLFFPDIKTRAENGEAEAQVQLGLKYYDGVEKGFPRDDPQAVGWFRKAAE